jgi:hypothetical protein
MAFISGQDYVAIATAYANARSQQLVIKDYLFDAVYEIVMLQEIVPEVDLLNEFYNSYQVNADLFSAPQTLLNAVRRLNNHVLNRSSYSTLDLYLEGESVTIPQKWADLCSAAGFTISESNIS